MKERPVFEQTTRDYLKRISEMDLPSRARELGAAFREDSVDIPLFGVPYRISPQGIIGPTGKKPDHAIAVVLCRYLLHNRPAHPTNEGWVSFKDFPDAAPLIQAFHNNAERAIARDFTGRLAALDDRCRRLGGREAPVEGAYDLKRMFAALPKVPILLLFNDADEEFPARCGQLFEARAGHYLDMESVAILGWTLADYLRGIRPLASGR